MNVSWRGPARIMLFLIGGFAAIILPMVPLGLPANSTPFPDILFLYLAVWCIRQPQTAPLLGVAFLALLSDAMLMRPLGLWALLLVAASEALRLGNKTFRETPFLLEWLYVAGLLATMSVLQNFLFMVTFSPMHGFWATVWHIGRSVALYPVVVGVLYYGFRVRRPDNRQRPNRLGVTP